MQTSIAHEGRGAVQLGVAPPGRPSVRAVEEADPLTVCMSDDDSVPVHAPASMGTGTEKFAGPPPRGRRRRGTVRES